MIIWIILATIIATALGGLFASRFSDKLHLILGFSAGTVIGVAFFDLIPESFELAENSKSIIPLLIAAGFIVYMIVDRSFAIHHHSEDHCANPGHKGEIGATTLVIHSLIDGLIIGLSFKVSVNVGWIVSSAVLVHKFSDGINTVSTLLSGGAHKKKALNWLVLAVIAPVVGLLISQFIYLEKAQLGSILGFFAGLFIYLGASDLVPESHHKHPTVWTTASTILGIALIYFAIKILG